MDPNAAEVPTWLMTLIAVVFFGGLAVVAFLLYERTRRQLEALAEELGLTLDEHGVYPIPRTFVLVGRSGWTGAGASRWVFEGEIERREVAAFQFRDIIDPNTSKTRGYPTTVVMVALADKTVPDFVLRPEGLRQRLAAAVSGDDIDFKDSARFSSLFRLQGDDEARIRETFTWDLRKHFERHPGRVTQVIGGELYHFKPTRMLGRSTHRPRRIRALLTEARNLAALLENSRR